MIVDCCVYAGERDLLELRLLTLDPVVDLFVICESDTTHQGDEKLLDRPDRRERFLRWRHKMQALCVTDMPAFPTRGGVGDRAYQKRERYQRDAIARLKVDQRLHDEDVIFISDVDELWAPDMLGAICDRLADSDWVVCEQRFHGFALDYLHPQQPWLGTCVSRLEDLAPQAMRDARGDTSRMVQVPNAGWHISWCGTAEERDRKLRTFSHAELVDRFNPAHAYETGRHSNGERLEPIDFHSYDWPKPIEDGTFQVPASWMRPQ